MEYVGKTNRKPLSEEHRRKISESLKGRTISLETRKKISEAGKKRALSGDSIRKMTDATRGKSLSEKHRKKISESLKGFVFSEERRKHQSESAKRRTDNRGRGRYRSEEHRKHLGLANKGKKRTEETKQKMRKSAIERCMRGKWWAQPETSLEKNFARLLDSIEQQYDKQWPVGGAIFDFYLPRYNLLIETNGTFWHADSRFYDDDSLSYIQKYKVKRDREKLVIALEGGYNYLCFWEHDVNTIPNVVLSELKHEIACLGEK